MNLSELALADRREGLRDFLRFCLGGSHVGNLGQRSQENLQTFLYKHEYKYGSHKSCVEVQRLPCVLATSCADASSNLHCNIFFGGAVNGTEAPYRSQRKSRYTSCHGLRAWPELCTKPGTVLEKLFPIQRLAMLEVQQYQGLPCERERKSSLRPMPKRRWHSKNKGLTGIAGKYWQIAITCYAIRNCAPLPISVGPDGRRRQYPRTQKHPALSHCPFTWF
jgi:hypothetical protein